LIVSRLTQLRETGRAAQLCVALNINGFNDWFLPSIDELSLMSENLYRKGLSDFTEDWYWSSSQSEDGRGYAYYIGFKEQFRGNTNLDRYFRVRAIRAF